MPSLMNLSSATRARILAFALPSGDTIDATAAFPRLFEVCQAIRAEALPIWRANNTFHIQYDIEHKEEAVTWGAAQHQLDGSATDFNTINPSLLTLDSEMQDLELSRNKALSCFTNGVAILKRTGLAHATHFRLEDDFKRRGGCECDEDCGFKVEIDIINRQEFSIRLIPTKTCDITPVLDPTPQALAKAYGWVASAEHHMGGGFGMDLRLKESKKPEIVLPGGKVRMVAKKELPMWKRVEEKKVKASSAKKGKGRKK